MNDVRASIVGHLEILLTEDGCDLPLMSDELILMDSGLDSLGFAVLVTRLEDDFGYDPFTIMTEAVYPRTLAEFVEVYEKYKPK